jgi:pimeloyl-ACP methyl ester carboxylesterase
MPGQPPERLPRKVFKIDGRDVGVVHTGGRWAIRRERLVLIHGSGCSADSWRYQVDGLLREFEIVAPDLPGHGASAPAGDPSVERYASVVRAVLQRIGRRKVFLAGHSLGGAVALQVALEAPQLLKGLILVATAAYLDTLALTPDILLWAIATLPHKFKGMFFSDLVTKEALAIARDDVRRCSLETVLGDFSASRKLDFRSRLGLLKLPALILCGSDDLITPVRYSQRLHQQISGSTLELVEKAGHMLPLESPERVNAAIRKFVRGI